MRAKGEALNALPGIGDDLAAKIGDIAETGTTPLRDKLRKAVPPALVELLSLPGIGPKRVRHLHQELDINTIAQLHRAAKDGRLRALPGFGAKTEQNILAAIEAKTTAPRRVKLAVAAVFADALVDYLKGIEGVSQVMVAGSFRRARETVGDLDILATASKRSPVIARFTKYPEARAVLAAGTTRATIVLRSGLQVDLRVVPDESYGSALHYFTGSKAHNIAIRRLGQERGLKINEYGVFKGDKRISGETEAQVFRAVGLPYIPPELREDQGEIEAARRGKLPALVGLDDLKGDLHAHTKATDGHDTIRDMARAAKALGFAYIAITEHSRHLTVAHGLDAKRLLKQAAEIDRLNGERLGIHIFKGIEVDILEDGRLDLPDDVLARLDLVIGAVHSNFKLSRAKQTERILRAMDRPHFSILAHPSGRLIPTREPYDVDMQRIVRKARERGCAIELNAHPERLDLIDVHCRLAKAESVPVAINSDAHSVRDFANLRFGVGQARRGWLEAADILNTRPLAAVRKFLARTM
jgi:DNA polymerase (family 10)